MDEKSPQVQEFSLGELAERAGVTPRTIRYYISNGLLPGPASRGPKATYGRGHLDRLRLIKRLQEQYLPLAEIRRAIEDLDDDGVRRSLQEQEEATDASTSSALDYVQELMAHRRPGHSRRTPSSERVPRQTTEAMVRPARTAASSSGPLVDAERPGSVPADAHTGTVAEEGTGDEDAGGWVAEQSRWDRFALAPDVELHVRRPLSPKDRRAVRELIEDARRLFGAES